MIQRHRRLCSNIIKLVIFFGGTAVGSWFEIDWLFNELSHYKKETCYVANHIIDTITPYKYKLQFRYCPQFTNERVDTRCATKTWKTVNDVTYVNAEIMLEEHRPLYSNLTCWHDERYNDILCTRYNCTYIVKKYLICSIMIFVFAVVSFITTHSSKKNIDKWMYVHVDDDNNDDVDDDDDVDVALDDGNDDVELSTRNTTNNA